MASRFARALPRWLLAGLAGLVGLTAAARLAHASCSQDLKIVGAEVAFRTHMLDGQPIRRNANLKITVRSTATTAISAVELAVFLGAHLDDIDETRVQALPSRRPRVFPSGGLAFRSEVETDLPAGAKRVLRFRQTGLPLDRDLYGVTAKVVGCRRLIPVGTATIALPPQEDPWLGWLYFGGLALAAVAGALVIGRLR